MQGRATLRLAERSASWHEKPNRRQLPTLWEFFNIYFYSRKMSWTDAQRAMMKVATKRIAFFTILGLVGIVTICTWLYQARSRAMIRDIVAFSPDMVQDAMSEWRFYSFWSYKHLYQALNEDNRHGKLNLAKLFSVYPDSSLPPKAVKHVNEELLRASPEDFESLRKWVEPFKVQLNDELWRSLELFRAGNSSNDGRTLRAAGSLATLDTSNHRWTEMDELVVIALLSAPRVQVDGWVLMLSPIGHRLTNSLQMASHGKPFTNPQRKWTDSERILAARIFATYCKEPKELAEMFLECEPDQSIPVLNALQQQTGLSKAHADFVRQRLREELPALPTQTKNPVEITIEEENEKDDLAKRQANAGIALLVLGDRDDRDLVRNRLFESAKEDPRASSFFINRAPRILPDPTIILNAFEAADDKSVRFRQACILMLGMYSLTTDERMKWEREFLRIYRKDLNSGIHGASEWLLRNWWTHDDGARLANERIQTERIKLAKELRNRPIDHHYDWFVTADGTTYSIVDFADGGYQLAVSTTEVTKKEFKRFLDTFDPYISSSDLNTNSPDDDCPVLGVNFFEAAAYCNWLSDSEGLGRCYEFSNRGQSRALGPNFLQDKVGQQYRNISKQSWEEFWTEIQVDIKEDGNGYRLPTELEWKHLCRAGANTKQHYGFSAELLGSYAVYSVNSSGSGLEETHPVGEKMPNAFGIFDVHGNVYEWCQPPYQRVNRDQESSVLTALGGCYGSTRRRLFVDEDLRKQAWNWDWKIGLRVVRKLADSDD